MAALSKPSVLALLLFAAALTTAGATDRPALVQAPAAAPRALLVCPASDQPCTGQVVRYSRHKLFECSKARHPVSAGSPQPLVSAAEECRVRVRSPKPCRCADIPPEPAPTTP